MKKLLAIALAIVIFCGSLPIYAYELPKTKMTTDNGEKVKILKDKDIIVGYEDGNLGLDQPIKRSELTKILVHALGEEKKAEALKGTTGLFDDVAKGHWANGYIAYAKNHPNPINHIPFIAGYPDGSFRPENHVTNAEVLKILVVLSKRNLTLEMVNAANWPNSWVQWAKEEKILGKEVGLDDLKLNAEALRGDVFVGLYNSLQRLQDTGGNSENTAKPNATFKHRGSRGESHHGGSHGGHHPVTPPAKDPHRELKQAVYDFIQSIEKEKIQQIADAKGKETFEIPPKDEAMKHLENNIQRALKLIHKSRLTAEEVKELEALRPVKHPKKDKLVDGLARDISHGFVVQWDVQGPRKIKNKDDSRWYTEFSNHDIVVKTNVVHLEDNAYEAYINYVTKEQYAAEGTIDTIAGATPRYKKQKLDPKFYTLEKTAEGLIYHFKTDDPEFQKIMENTAILKPIVKVPVADRVKIENGDLVFVKEKTPTPTPVEYEGKASAEIVVGKTLTEEDLIFTPALPSGSHVGSIENINTEVTGEQTGTVAVTFSDQSIKEIVAKVNVLGLNVNFHLECEDDACEYPYIYEAISGQTIEAVLTTARVDAATLEEKAKPKPGEEFKGWKIQGDAEEKIYDTEELLKVVVADTPQTPLQKIPPLAEVPDAVPYYNLEIEPVYEKLTFHDSMVTEIEFIHPENTPTYQEGETFDPSPVKVRLKDDQGLEKEVSYGEFESNQLKLTVNDDPMSPDLKIKEEHDKLVVTWTGTPQVTKELSIVVTKLAPEIKNWEYFPLAKTYTGYWLKEDDPGDRTKIGNYLQAISEVVINGESKPLNGDLRTNNGLNKSLKIRDFLLQDGDNTLTIKAAGYQDLTLTITKS